MSNLKVLSIFSELLPQQDLDIPVPKLSAISVHGTSREMCENLTFLARITYLEILKLEDWLEVRQDGLDGLLCALPKLSHLYLGTEKQLFLPAYSPCYNTLRELFIRNWSCDVGQDLVSAIIQCGSLRVLQLTVRGFEVTSNIRRIATSLASLSLFRVYVSRFEGKEMTSVAIRRAHVFAKSVIGILKEEGRVLDLRICNRDDYKLLQFLV